MTVIVSQDSRGPERGTRQRLDNANADLLPSRPLGMAFGDIEIQQYFSIKIYLNMSSAAWRTFCLGLNLLINTLTGAA